MPEVTEGYRANHSQVVCSCSSSSHLTALGNIFPYKIVPMMLITPNISLGLLFSFIGGLTRDSVQKSVAFFTHRIKAAPMVPLLTGHGIELSETE